MFKSGFLHGAILGWVLSGTVFVLVSIFAAWAFHP
jgi:hypothetical protein